MAVISFLMRNGQQLPVSIPLNTLDSPFAFVYFTIAFCSLLFFRRDSRRIHRSCRRPRLENAGTKWLRPVMTGISRYLQVKSKIDCTVLGVILVTSGPVPQRARKRCGPIPYPKRMIGRWFSALRCTHPPLG